MFRLFIKNALVLFVIIITSPILSQEALSQCLTDYTKIGPPERFKSKYSHRFGRDIDIYENISIVGVSASDSLQATAGLAFIYEYNGSSWNKIGTLSSSNPMPGEGFGSSVQIIKDLIIVTIRTNNLNVPNTIGKVYIFEKPASGWQSMTESATISLSADENQVIDAEINKENNAIAVINNNGINIFYKSTSNWQNASTPNFVIDYKSTDFSIRDVTIDNNSLAVGLEGDRYNDDRVLVYQNFSGDWTVTQIVQTITRNNDWFADDVMLINDQLLVSTVSFDSDSIFLYTTTNNWNTVDNEVVLTSAYNLINSGEKAYGAAIDMNDTTIMVCRADEQLMSQPHISIYRKPSSGWIDAEEDQHFVLEESKVEIHTPPIAFSGNHLIGTLSVEDPGFDGSQVLFYEVDESGYSLNTRLKYREYNTTGIKYGKKVAIHSDGSVMAVSALHDENTSIYGGVLHLYGWDSNNWTFLCNVSPPEADTADINFGYDVKFDNEYMLVSAITYQEPNTNRHTGAVYVYKKSGPTWLNPTQIAKLRPSDWADAAGENNGSWLNFGRSIAIEGNTIAIGAPGKDIGNDSDHGRIYIFEKTTSTEWTSGYETAILKASDAIQNSAIGRSISLDNQIIATAENWSDEYNIGNVYLFKRPATGWKDTTESYQIKLKTNPGDPIGYFGLRDGQIILKDDLLFVGFPFEEVNGTSSSGTIFVLKKSPVGWQEVSSINQVKFNSPEKAQFLGYEFDVKGNILIAGSSFIMGQYYYGPKDGKGYSTVFQSLTGDWSETIELIKLEGNKSTPIDGFGVSVNLANDVFVIGSYFDDSETGFASGAVYSIPSPPIVYLEDPVCHTSDQFKLNAYPGNGTWAGAGIVDEGTGLFDPGLAGVGLHVLTYTTSDCAYKGRLKIEIQEPQTIEFVNELRLALCEDEKAQLEYIPVQNTNYQWFYIPSEGTEPELFSVAGNLIEIDKPGQYFVKASNGLCSNTSETIHVRQLITSVEIDPTPTICDKSNSIPIQVDPPSGKWNTRLIKDNILDPSPLNNGNYEFVYTVSLENTCNYSDTLQVTVDILSSPDVTVNDPDLCKDGAELIADEDDQLQYLWEVFKYDDWITAPDNFDEAYYSTNENGNYRLTVTKHTCSFQTETFEIKSLPPDSLFVPNIVTSNGDGYNDSFNVYKHNLENIQLAIYNRWGEKIYSNNDYDDSWPKNDIHSGVYFYTLKYNSKCKKNEVAVVRGSITVF